MLPTIPRPRFNHRDAKNTEFRFEYSGLVLGDSAAGAYAHTRSCACEWSRFSFTLCFLTIGHLNFLLTDSRWIWYLRGLPSFARAHALYSARNATMTSFTRCYELWNLSKQILQKRVPGAFVECGVWRGGSAGIMGLAIQNGGQNRTLHLFDSFEGLPEPGEQDGREAQEYSGGKASGRLNSIAKCEATLPVVRSHLFEKLGLAPANVSFHVGWFQDTLPKDAKDIGPIAVLRLDGDWYDSTRVCLEHLYPLLSPGGAVILDDYNFWEGCRKATDEYREKHGISTPLIRVDRECSYWLKE